LKKLISGFNLVKIESEELKDLVKSTIEGIEKGLKKGYSLQGDIEFEVAVVNVKKAEGGVKLLVVSATGKYDKENISKIRFKVSQDFPSDLGGANLWSE